MRKLTKRDLDIMRERDGDWGDPWWWTTDPIPWRRRDTWALVALVLPILVGCVTAAMVVIRGR